MDLDPAFLSRVQFAFVISFHIIFPAFTIGLAAWLATIEGARFVTGNTVYRKVFDFWLKIFAFLFLFLWFRATFPRYRYDQIMRLGWKALIPVTIVWIFVEGVMAYLKVGPWAGH